MKLPTFKGHGGGVSSHGCHGGSPSLEDYFWGVIILLVIYLAVVVVERIRGRKEVDGEGAPKGGADPRSSLP